MTDDPTDSNEPSDPSRTARALDLFARVCELPAEQHEAWLAEHCDDDTVRAEVRGLLAADSGPSLVGPTPADVLGALRVDAPRQLGDFELLEVLGRGGMGTVWRARQEHPAREVAVKVLDRRWISTGARRRFEREVELLGRLDHPGLARIHAAGPGDEASGEPPWFAMELVDGLPLVEHARTHGLDRRARLELLARVCDAVEHAHRHGVIHRDLKSANVLVDGDGQPHVLDFGVARVLDDGATLTDEGHIVGTLATMSPEQARGDGAPVDTRADVYALGVLLFQLLTERLPHPTEGLAVPEALHRLLEEPAPRPSRLDPSLAGDLDVIVGKALQKRPADRYGSPGALADDLRRHLGRRTILAAAPDPVDRALRFVRRNALLVGTGVLVAAGLTATTVSSVLSSREAEARRSEAEFERREADAARLQAVREREQADAARDAAERERGLADAARTEAERQRQSAEDARAAAEEQRLAADTARALAEAERSAAEHERDRFAQLFDLLKGTFGVLDPNRAEGREITVREMLDASAAELAAAPPEDVDLAASMHALLGDVYGDLSLLDSAAEQLRAALALVDGPQGAHLDGPTLARVLGDLAQIATNDYDLPAAEQLFLRLERHAESAPDVDPAVLALALRGRARLQHLAIDVRLELSARALEIIEAHGPQSLRDDLLADHAMVLMGAGRHDEARPLLERAAASAQASERHSLEVRCRGWLASIHAGRGDSRAFDELDRVLQILDALLGPDHPQTHAHWLDVAYTWSQSTGQLPAHLGERLARAAPELDAQPAGVGPNAWRQLAALHEFTGDDAARAIAVRRGLELFADDLAELRARFDPTDGRHPDDVAGQPRAEPQRDILLGELLADRSELSFAAGEFGDAAHDARLAVALSTRLSARTVQALALPLFLGAGLDAALDAIAPCVQRMRTAGDVDRAARTELITVELLMLGGGARERVHNALHRARALLDTLPALTDADLRATLDRLARDLVAAGDDEGALMLLEPLAPTP